MNGKLARTENGKVILKFTTRHGQVSTKFTYKTVPVFIGRRWHNIKVGVDVTTVEFGETSLRVMKQRVDEALAHLDSDLYKWACRKTGGAA